MFEKDPGKKAWLLVGTSLAVVVAFFVLREHWAHVLGLTPYLLLLACPLLHLFHGRGHHGRQHGHGPEGDEAR